jgi:hypothetical protein
METTGIEFKGKSVTWLAPPPPPGTDWPTERSLALAFLSPEEEQEVYRKLEFSKVEVEEFTRDVANVRARQKREEKERREKERAREKHEAKERERQDQKAQQDATSKAKSQALQRAAREEEERERKAAFQRALAKRDALAAEAEAAARAKAVEEARKEAAPSRPRKRNYRQRQKHKERQQLEAIEAKQLTTQLTITDAPPPLSEPNPEDELLCSICMEGEKTHACLPCGHRCLCASCAEPSLKLETCPICRVPVLMRARIYV